MIKSFKCKDTQKIYNREFSKKFHQEIQKIALRKLWMIDAAEKLIDLKHPPANRLEKLTGNRKGQFSIRINKQWRICFDWKNNDAHNVEITDYH
ncbi:MAG: type II toxin-antitoxin system RelE/ParE family toxin [Candidatus Marinimicrobia bacterium]|nr:type II toxin-antitoxin system RelE/ParE family toxin [Candidatus Neomarinimicrobiota bacterium]MCH7763776.1 type II toxin-antitoxin system RelE/ParE family toxin [Candidatus Neomarinimicrobiota bacterium]